MRSASKVVGLCAAVALVAAVAIIAATSATPTASAISTGGVLKIAAGTPVGKWDPALFPGDPPSILIMSQVYEKLAYLGDDFKVYPELATKWVPSSGGKVWTYTLRGGVTFSNGQPFSADDVVYTIDRLRSTTLGSPMSKPLSVIASDQAADATHVKFTLTAPNAEFPNLLTDYRCGILCKSVSDPMTNMVGTGPFTLKSFTASYGAVLTKNPNYWQKDSSGTRLPYLAEIDYVVASSSQGQVSGLMGGSFDYLMSVDASSIPTIKKDAKLKLAENKCNTVYTLQIPCFKGPAKKVKFRQALLAGTDFKAIAKLTMPGIAFANNNSTFVGPAYTGAFLNSRPPYSIATAKKLLKQAGYPHGVSIPLVVISGSPYTPIATAWQAQMKKIGVNVKLQVVPEDVFWENTSDFSGWINKTYCLTEYGTRSTPSTYYNLIMTKSAPWNFGKWYNAKFDALVKLIPKTVDTAKRNQLYQQTQKILQSQVPLMNLVVSSDMVAYSAQFTGFKFTSQPPWPILKNVHLAH